VPSQDVAIDRMSTVPAAMADTKLLKKGKFLSMVSMHRIRNALMKVNTKQQLAAKKRADKPMKIWVAYRGVIYDLTDSGCGEREALMKGLGLVKI